MIRVMGTEEIKVRRGEIHWVDKPASTYGSELQKSRPAVIVSNNEQNDTAPNIQIVYMTTQPKHSLPTHVKIKKTSNGQAEGSTVLCEGIYTISKERLQDGYSYMARVSEEDMEAIDNALIVAQGLDDYFEEEEDADYQPPEKPECSNIENLIALNETKEELEQAQEDLRRAQMEAEFYKAQYEAIMDRVMQKAKI